MDPLFLVGGIVCLGVALVLAGLFVPFVDCPDCGPIDHAYLELAAMERDLPPRSEALCRRCKDARTITVFNRWFGTRHDRRIR